MAAGKLRPKEAALYIISQIIGAVIGAAVVYSIFGSSMSASVTLPSDGNVVRAFVLETVMTFTLVYVVLATTTSKNFKIAPLAGVAIGFTLGFNVMFGGSISGGSKSSSFLWPCTGCWKLQLPLALLDSTNYWRINFCWSIQSTS